MLRLLFFFQDGTFLGGLVVVLSNPDVKIVTTALEVHVYICINIYQVQLKGDLFKIKATKCRHHIVKLEFACIYIGTVACHPSNYMFVVIGNCFSWQFKSYTRKHFV